MHFEKQRALIAAFLFAAFARSAGLDRKRKETSHSVDTLATDIDVLNFVEIYQSIVPWRAHLDAAATALDTPALRRLAFKMAMYVCDAD